MAINDQPLGAEVTKILEELSEGNYQLQLLASSSSGCGSEQSLTLPFTIKAKPVITHKIKDGCINEDINLSALQVDDKTTINLWQWQVGSNRFNQQNISITYPNKGKYELKTWAQAENGCVSDTLKADIFINKAEAFAGRDTLVIKNIPFKLNASGNGSFTWTPATGLDNPMIYNPVVTLADDQVYYLTVITPEGCIAMDTLKIEVFKNSAVFVPNAFTPDNDGLNDIFKPIYTGINTLHYFYIYNRWGNLIFKTTSINQGWDGRSGSNNSLPGTYVWVLKAEDLAGKIYNLKGTINLIR